MEYCANAAAPLETKIKRHIYATLNSRDVIKIISLEAETAAEIRPPAIFNLIKKQPIQTDVKCPRKVRQIQIFIEKIVQAAERACCL